MHHGALKRTMPHNAALGGPERGAIVTTKHNCYDLSQHTSTIEGNPLQKKETPYYRRKSLTIEGNPLL